MPRINFIAHSDLDYLSQGWRQEFSDGEADSSDEGAKNGFQGTITTKHLRKNRYSPSNGGLECYDGGP